MRWFLLLSLLVSVALKAQEGSFEISKAKFKYELVKAQQASENAKYDIALEIYRQLLLSEPEHPECLYHNAEIYYQLGYYDDALDWIIRLKALADKEIPRSLTNKVELLAARIFYQHHDISNCLSHLDTYISNASELDLEKEKIPQWITQISNFRRAALPELEVVLAPEITGLNSAFDDLSAAVNWADSTLYFSSKRPISMADSTSSLSWKNSRESVEAIYKTYGRSVQRVFDLADYHLGLLSFHPSEDLLYVYQSDAGAGDVFYSKKSGKKNTWSKPRAFTELNSSYYESSMVVSPDGNYLFFVSERLDGYGDGDIYYCKKEGKSSWSLPKNLGPLVNSTQDEKYVSIHPNGETLIFASNKAGGFGSYDFYKVTFRDSVIGPVDHFPYPINSPGEESFMSFDQLLQKVFIVSQRAGGKGQRDIYTTDFTASFLNYTSQLDSTLLFVEGRITSLKANKNKSGLVRVYADGKLQGMAVVDDEGRFDISLFPGTKYEVVYSDWGLKKSAVKTWQTPTSIDKGASIYINYPG